MDIRRLSIYGFYVGMGLATLTKGPVGLFLPLLASLFYLLIQKDWRGIKGMRILSGMILFLAIVLSWYIPAILKGGEAYLNETLFHQTIDYYSKGWDHPKPIYFYLRNFPVDFLPWILFFPGAMVYGYSKEACGKRKEFLFLLTWFIVIFLFFSLSKAKRDLYLLPLYPAASLMIGKFWGDLIFERIEHFRKKWISLPLYGFMGLSLAAGLIIFWEVSKKFPSYLLYTLPITCFLVGGSIVLFFLYRFKKYGIIFFLSILMAAGGFFYIENILFPLEKRLKPTRSISYEMKKEISLISP
jgi:4-amino-4-deoxy-L-arabinose transferase-like glycosyltransferase